MPIPRPIEVEAEITSVPEISVSRSPGYLSVIALSAFCVFAAEGGCRTINNSYEWMGGNNAGDRTPFALLNSFTHYTSQAAGDWVGSIKNGFMSGIYEANHRAQRNGQIPTP